MPTTLDTLADDALILPPEQRLALAFRLLKSVESEDDLGAEAAWDSELAQRLERIDAGNDPGRPAEEVLAEIRARYSLNG